MAGTIVADTISDGAGNTTAMDNAIYGSAKAWVNFDGTTGTKRASYNVSSVTRAGTGQYTIVFTNALADANYAVTACSGYTQGGATNSMGVVSITGNTPLTASQFQIITEYANTDLQDNGTVCVACFR